jgi:hypothetical protein
MVVSVIVVKAFVKLTEAITGATLNKSFKDLLRQVHFFIFLYKTRFWRIYCDYSKRERVKNMTTIFRVEKNQNFVVMSNHHLRNKEMSLKSKGLLSLILSLPPSWNYSLAGLCAICKESQTAMRSALKELETHKYLLRKRKKNALGHFEYEYIVYEVPYTENQHADKGHTQNEHTENRTQISKEKKNKDKSNKDVINKDIYKGILREQVEDVDLIELYEDYIEMRKNINAPLNEKGLELLIDRCNRLSKNNARVQKVMLEAALINSWKNVFLPKEEEVAGIHKEATNELKSFYGLDN